MDSFRLGDLETECLQMVEDPKVRLDTKDTGRHYRLPSGDHTNVFHQVARLFEYGPSREKLADLLRKRIIEAGVNPGDIKVFLGPAQGALPVMYTLQHFQEFKHIRVIYAEHDRSDYSELVLGRGFSIHPDEGVVIVDDAVRTNRTYRKTVNAAHKACASRGWEASVLGSVVLLDLAPEVVPANYQVIMAPTRFYVYGLRIPTNIYQADSCQLCFSGIPVADATDLCITSG